jgi:predicted small lipoprotein YifL
MRLIMTAQTPFIRWAKRLTLLTLLAALALPMAGCGKKAPLDPPPGAEDSPFPRAYPTH